MVSEPELESSPRLGQSQNWKRNQVPGLDSLGTGIGIKKYWNWESLCSIIIGHLWTSLSKEEFAFHPKILRCVCITFGTREYTHYSCTVAGSAKFRALRANIMNCLVALCMWKGVYAENKVQTTLRVVENFGGRVFSTTESFSTIESAQI